MGQNFGKLEKLDAGSTVNYGATVIYGGPEMVYGETLLNYDGNKSKQGLP